MKLDTLRFELRVVDTETGETVVSDYTSNLTPIDQFGNCESVDIHVGAALRFVRREMSKATGEA